MSNDQGLFNMSAGDEYHLPGWFGVREGEFLRFHAANVSCPHVLEIGVFYGRSASFIIEGLRQSTYSDAYKLWCVDPWFWLPKRIAEVYGWPPVKFWEFMVKHNYHQHINLLNTTSAIAAPIILNRRYDFAFIDGFHEEPGIMHDLVLCSQVTNTIFIHDYADDYPQVMKSVDYWVENTKWEIQKQVARTVKMTGPLLPESHLKEL
jgi:hypothetical protein